MLFPVGGRWLTALLALGFCTTASADDVLFENVRIFDGKSAALSAPSNVLIKGKVIERISTAPIAIAGALRIAGNGRLLQDFDQCEIASIPPANVVIPRP